MNTKLLMTSSGFFMAASGITLSFFPHEILQFADQKPSLVMDLVLQVLGALYLGFAMLNWMAKGNLIGGIYSRPVAIGNLAHFLIAGLALLKAAFTMGNSPFVWALAIIYAGFALAFGLVTFTHPAKVKAAV
ncbi:hypothetical protein [Adhaeribacter soli]|uniref:Uncharacterized protein n=1 Tax=Adhaeribacter soli TaxID=2607655 RepID=A0A5N1IR11_9BACT|nr:hypothetical protein [Adhaeribacter soli]KAA9331965.1 hypothetical protein F0P94_14315 [Adhaeribacter soli]